MPSMRHLVAHVEGSGALLAMGKVTGATGVLTQLSPPLAQQADITCVRSAAGTYTITINPFKGPLGSVNVSVDAVATADRALTVTSTTYTGDSLAIAIKARSITGAPADSDVDFFFSVMAW